MLRDVSMATVGDEPRYAFRRVVRGNAL